ncbi:restriction endonuclease subunit S [Jeongeupia chitinilytica]|uniref:Restriction endonuclease subunit S n=1 Tax=Jeongeupia chitinilytica TaxID=1041641 RepID=A0ABQ3GVF2_9NEIS|nr:restriction endonuclease subunit S [Jeongeupia chitinilytica]GHD56965.1 restriction endonuclease subunit S [Jeongeupia chitinilytica]
MSGLPKGWAECELQVIAEDVSYGYTAKANSLSGDARMLRITDIQDNKVNWSSVPFCDISHDGLAKYSLNDGDIVFARTGATVGKSFLIVSDIKNAVFASYLIRVRPTLVETSKYLNYFFGSDFYWNQITEFSSGIGQPNVNGSKLKALKIQLAPLPEQKRIADKLDATLARVDACRERLARVAPILKRFRQSVLAAATSGRLTEDWRDSRKLALDWVDSTFGEIALDLRYGTAKKCSEVAIGSAVLRIPNIGADGAPNLNDLKYAEFDEIERAKLVLRIGDLLIIRSNGSVDLVGKASVIDSAAEGMLFAGYLIRLRPDEIRIIPKFSWMVISSPQIRQVIEMTAKSTSGVNNINSEELRSLPLRLPSIDEQTEIIHRVETLFAFAERLEARLAAAQTAADRLTPSLLAKAFRGELVPQDPNDEPASELLKRLATQREAAPKPKRGRKGVQP